MRSKLPATDKMADIMDKAVKTGALFDLMETREIVECRSAELAAIRATGPQRAKLKKTIQRLKKCLDTAQEYIDADCSRSFLPEGTERCRLSA